MVARRVAAVLPSGRKRGESLRRLQGYPRLTEHHDGILGTVSLPSLDDGSDNCYAVFLGDLAKRGGERPAQGSPASFGIFGDHPVTNCSGKQMSDAPAVAASLAILSTTLALRTCSHDHRQPGQALSLSSLRRLYLQAPAGENKHCGPDDDERASITMMDGVKG